MTRAAACVAAAALLASSPAPAQEPLPALTGIVNDFASVIDPTAADEIERISERLRGATGDVIVVAAVPTFAPYPDIQSYAVELFENRGRGIGDRERDGGALILLAVEDREVWIEVGYGLEPYITDGFAGGVSRDYMVPHFRRGDYGTGLAEGVAQLAVRIAEAKGVRLDDVAARPPPSPTGMTAQGVIWLVFIVGFFVLQGLAMRAANRRRRRRRRHWGVTPWSGWTSGIGSFGAGSGFGGGFGASGGFGGGFGGFSGGMSGGGGGGASW